MKAKGDTIETGEWKRLWREEEGVKERGKMSLESCGEDECVMMGKD
ncbi:hypothetical protein COLO4_34226 [Corchorus olitorius]|uniref:Uncharacterized protein n=1 Tax=Corchorus olitorius TaxID=93759 RepID=A0A1R3GMT4_9ROSI|nr:hypothetical protein COLO4_34226 [Corchorus olitorius]